jgi:ankyrin repeat protein
MNKIAFTCACALLIFVSCSKKADLNRRLIDAVVLGDIAKVDNLLARGADVNAREEVSPGRTALIIAAGEDDGEIAAALLKQGADVNAMSGDGSSALMYAAMEGNADIVKMLLAQGAEVNASDNLGQTALIKASADGHETIVEILAAGGADINLKDKIGISAVMKSMINGHSEITGILMKRGAKLTDQDRLKIQEAVRINTQQEEVLDSENK